MRTRSILSNAVATACGEVIGRLAQLASLLIIGRSLGPSGLAVVGTGWAFYNMALPAVQHSPELIGIRSLGWCPRKLAVVGEIGIVKVVAAAGSILVIGILAATIYPSGPLRSQLFAQAIVLLGLTLTTDWVFRGLQRFEVHALLRSAQAVLLCGVLLITMRGESSALWVPISELLSLIAATSVGFGLLHYSLGKRRFRLAVSALTAARRPALKHHAGPIIQQSLSGLASTFKWWVGIPLAVAALNPEQAGILTAAVRVTLGFHAILLLGLQVFFPVLSGLRGPHRLRRQRMTAALLFYSGVAAAAISFGLAIGAEPACQLLLGPAFRETASLLGWIGLGLIPASQIAVLTLLLLATGRERVVLVVGVFSAVLTAFVMWLAFTIRPAGNSAAILPAVLVVEAAVMWAYCRRTGLLGRSRFAARQPRIRGVFSFDSLRNPGLFGGEK